jgi:hypothetical protein
MVSECKNRVMLTVSIVLVFNLSVIIPKVVRDCHTAFVHGHFKH